MQFHLIGKKHDRPIQEDLMKLFNFQSPYQVDMLSMAVRGMCGKKFSLSLKEESGRKTHEALGYYFGAIVPATALDMLGLRYDEKNVYEDWKFYRQQKKVTQKQFDAADMTLRLEFHYSYTRMLNGKITRVPAPLGTEDNRALRELIDKVTMYRAENGFPYLDPEKYKFERDLMSEKSHIEYPVNNLKPKF